MWELKMQGESAAGTKVYAQHTVTTDDQVVQQNCRPKLHLDVMAASVNSEECHGTER